MARSHGTRARFARAGQDGLTWAKREVQKARRKAQERKGSGSNALTKQVKKA
jgi:hypothetical protein